MSASTIHLTWHGPYSIVDGATDPNLLKTKPSIANERGLYLWTFPIGDEYWVYYVGKAEDQNGLLKRLSTEFKAKNPQQAYIDDPVKLLQGVRVNLYQPKNSKGLPDEESWQKNPEHFTASLNRFYESIRVFIAPMPDALEYISQTEGALCEFLWKYEDANWGNRPTDDYYYLSNGSNGLKRPNEALTVTMTFPAKIRGLEEHNDWQGRK